MPSSRIMLAVLAVTAGTSGCASVAVPINFSSPEVTNWRSTGESEPEGADQQDAVLGALRVTARAGADYIEIRIRNTGAEAVLVDWSGSSFISPSGRGHALITAEWLVAGQGGPTTQLGIEPGMVGEMVSAAPLWRPGPAATHGSADALHMKRQPLRRIEPGTLHVAVLYPAEHFGAGSFRMHPAASLLCDASPAATQPVGLSLRWHGAAGWRVDELVGTVGFRTARQGAATLMR
jgi:hypothetical protein